MTSVPSLFRSRSRRSEPPGDEENGAGPDGAAAGDEGMDLTDDPDGDWLAYELHEWASESRRMLQQLVVAEEIAHAWQGTTLLVHHADEGLVDELIEEVEAAAERRLDPERETIAFEMATWSGELQAELVRRLGAAGVPHEFDAEGDLVVHAEDEDVVELMIDDIVARADELDLEEVEGLEINDLLSRLFLACDRLRRDVHDPDGVIGLVESGRRLAGVRTPFGFEAPAWTALREATARLVGMIEGDAGDDDEVIELAGELRDRLQRII